MSIASFKKSVWETALLTEFRGVSVANTITTPPSKVEGEKAIFNQVSGGTVKDYTGTVTYDEATTTPIELPFDKKKYYAMSLDDVDRVQAAGPVLSVICNEKALDLKEAQDQIVFAEMEANVPTANKIGSKSAKKAITDPIQAYDYVVDLATILSKNKVPMSNRYCLASSEFINLMAKDKRFVDNFNVLSNGVIQGATVGGFTLVQTEDLPTAGTVLACHKSGVGYATQLSETEALRLQGSFSDAIRGLQVSGVKTLKDKCLAELFYTIGSTQA